MEIGNVWSYVAGVRGRVVVSGFAPVKKVLVLCVGVCFCGKFLIFNYMM